MSTRQPRNSSEARIAVLESEMHKLDGFFSRLDVSIEKITELNVSIREVLSSHETRLNATEIELESQFTMFDQKYEQLHSRITTVQRELSEEMKDETRNIIEALKELRSDMNKHQAREEDRIRHIERRQWLIMGAAAALGFIIGNSHVLTGILG